MGGAIVSRLIVLVGGMLYPAYGSYKAVKSANVRQYVRWMMYWVVFALFTTVETFTDIFLSWMPFYYEIKVGFVIWLLSPYTKGAAFLYRKFVHPTLSRREPEIDNFLTSAKERSYATMLDVGSRGINVAANAVVTAAVKGQAVVSDRLKSFSVNDISRLSDDTPIHSMNPGAYNPQIQREVPRRTDAPRYNVEPREPMQIQHRHYEQGNSMNADPYDVGYDEADTGGLVMRDMPDGTGDFAYIGYQNKAYSMMNLSQTTQNGETIMTRRIEYTSAPPETTVDDSVIPDHRRSSEDEHSFSTLPRQRRKKKRDEESTSVRRSKRKIKAQSYHEPSVDERDFQ